MFLVIALCVIVPVIEITVFVQVAHWIGGWEALFLLLAISLAGAWMVKVQGVGVIRRVRSELRARQVPGRSLVDGLLLAAAGLLLLIPGFVTAALGLLLLIPAIRIGSREFVVRRWTRRFPVGAVTYIRGPGGAVDADSRVAPDRSEPEQLRSQRAIDPGGDPRR